MWEVVEYGSDLLKRCLRFARQNPENMLFREKTVTFFNLIFIYEQWLVITASWEDLAAVVFMSNKFMSSCVREIFLLQSDCSVIKKCIIFRYWARYNLQDKQALKTKNTLHNLDIFRHGPISGVFPLKGQSLRQTFQRISYISSFAAYLRHSAWNYWTYCCCCFAPGKPYERSSYKAGKYWYSCCNAQWY